MIKNHRNLILLGLLLSVVACSSSPPAPVIDRLPTKKSSSVNKPNEVSKTNANKPTYKTGDWRPDTYIVKKGDTLFSIGLEHGYDYKEIAQANNIAAPYSIKVGQTLKFSALNDKLTTTTSISQDNKDGVEITPIISEPNSSSSSTTTTSNTIPVAPKVIAISEPKAIREPYSEDALKKLLPAAKPIITKPAVDKTTTDQTPADSAATKPAVVATPSTTKPTADVKSNTEAPDDMDWAWPTKGKVTASFNEATNKGIDIAGTTGQAINAAAAGKVIYSGSDLRGYGKLVIIKHNSSYLSVYAHNSQIVVKEGQQVSRGQKIAEMGNTDSNSVNLHFEIRRQGKSVDPSKYLTAN